MGWLRYRAVVIKITHSLSPNEKSTYSVSIERNFRDRQKAEKEFERVVKIESEKVRDRIEKERQELDPKERDKIEKAFS